MNPEDKAVLKKILAKYPNELTEHEKGVLRARWHYVGRKERDKFAEVLGAKPEHRPAPKTQDSSEEEAIKERLDTLATEPQAQEVAQPPYEPPVTEGEDEDDDEIVEL